MNIMNRLSLADYPNLDLADSGKLPNIGYGEVEGVRAHCIAGGATTTLLDDITASQTSFAVEDASRFPDAPFIVQLASERMLVTAKTEAGLAVTRGHDGTAASAHAKGKTVFEAPAEYVYLVSPEPVREISGVYVDGMRQACGFRAYTGKAGDEHPLWHGKAVIAFGVEPKIIRQRNTEGRPAVEIDAFISKASHREAASGGLISIGGKIGSKAWAAFTGAGTIAKQTCTAEVKNTGPSEGLIRAVIKDMASGKVIRQEKISVPAGSTKLVCLSDEGGAWETEFALIAYKGGFEVGRMRKTVTVLSPPEDEAFEKFSPPVAAASLGGGALRAKGTTSAWAAYPSTERGTLGRQRHSAKVYNTGVGKAKVRLSACEPDGKCISYVERTVGAGASETIELDHPGGRWDAMTKLVLISGEAKVEMLSKEIYCLPAGVFERPRSSSSARVVIGGEVSVDAKWSEDITGGFGGGLIERPDNVIKHFLVRRMGFADVDEDSFGQAGAAYASVGYKLGFVINEKLRPSGFLRRLALECRSALRYENGRWRLDYIHDSAPAALRLIKKEGLAGAEGVFLFHKSPIEDITNDLTARFGRSYSEGGWLGVIGAEDAASKAKFGTLKKDIEFQAVRHREMAEHVLAHMLLKSKSPRLRVEFPVFWEHFDLRAGDAIEIDDPIAEGKTFLIEEMLRADKFHGIVKAAEWWG